MSLGIVFPGQGSQSVGMLTDVAAEFPLVRELFEQAGEIIGLPLWQIVSEGPEELLAPTEVTQPALLTAGVALWALWQSQGGRTAAFMAGHSLGEYSALVCAGAIEFTDAVRLVNQRENSCAKQYLGAKGRWRRYSVWMRPTSYHAALKFPVSCLLQTSMHRDKS